MAVAVSFGKNRLFDGRRRSGEAPDGTQLTTAVHGLCRVETLAGQIGSGRAG